MSNENHENDITFYTKQVDSVLKYHNKNKNIPFIALLLSAIKKPWGNKIIKSEQLISITLNQEHMIMTNLKLAY